jgi:F-type H+-transporting ATPase subunit epsilon
MAEQKLLTLTISRVDEPVFDGEVISVQVPGIDGEMEILADHEALISPLKAGTLTIKKAAGELETHEITSGTLEVSHNHATILI